METMFKTPYGERKHHFIEAGRPEADKYQHEINKHGMKELVKTGTTNIYAKIQEAYEETKIENIIARVTAGDVSMLRANGQYIDTTEIPNNMIEARQAIQKLENTWKELPTKIKENYNFSVEEYIAKAGTEQWMIDMGYLKKTNPTPKQPKEEKKGESEE